MYIRTTNSEERSVKLGGYRRKESNTKPRLPPAPFKAQKRLHYQRKLCDDPDGHIEKKHPAAELIISQLVTQINYHLSTLVHKKDLAACAAKSQLINGSFEQSVLLCRNYAAGVAAGVAAGAGAAGAGVSAGFSVGSGVA